MQKRWNKWKTKENIQLTKQFPESARNSSGNRRQAFGKARTSAASWCVSEHQKRRRKNTETWKIFNPIMICRKRKHLKKAHSFSKVVTGEETSRCYSPCHGHARECSPIAPCCPWRSWSCASRVPGSPPVGWPFSATCAPCRESSDTRTGSGACSWWSWSFSNQKHIFY